MQSSEASSACNQGMWSTSACNQGMWSTSACNQGMWSTFEAVNVAPLRNERRVERPVPATIEMSSCPKCTCVLSQQSCAITLHAITLHAITLHAITLHAIKAMLEADLRAFSKVFDLTKHHLNRPREPNDANHQRQVIGQQRPEEARRGPHRPAGDSTGHQRLAEESICTYPKLLPYVSLMT
jgi:hypothetical protein